MASVGSREAMRRSLNAVLFCALALVPVGGHADVASDQAAAILVFPKILVDTADPPLTPRGRIDTLIRISNTSTTRSASAHCFYINANGHCRNSQGTICNPFRFATTDSPCGPTGFCEPGWIETDFDIHLTPGQPIAWLASLGATSCDPGDTTGVPCLPLQQNQEGRVPGVSEDPFIGELKCIQVDRNRVPVDFNDLKGEAQIIQSNAGQLDVTGYNAIGIPALPGRNNGDGTLVLGGPGAEYSSCPNVLILDHFFDGATDPIARTPVTTELTLVPCSQDFLRQAPTTTTVQFLVFNEFEQRLSTSRGVTCYDNIKISNIETRSSDSSIFSAAVMGTITGQTRIKGVGDRNTLLGVAEEFRAGGGSAAVNLHFQGTRPTSDFIYLPPN